DRAPAGVEAFHHEQLPERPGAIEPFRHRLPDQLTELGVAARRRQRGPAYVAVRVEAAVLHPDRVREAEGRTIEAHRVARDQVDPLPHSADDGLAFDPALEDEDAPDMHVDRSPL